MFPCNWNNCCGYSATLKCITYNILKPVLSLKPIFVHHYNSCLYWEIVRVCQWWCLRHILTSVAPILGPGVSYLTLYWHFLLLSQQSTQHCTVRVVVLLVLLTISKNSKRFWPKHRRNLWIMATWASVLWVSYDLKLIIIV